MRWNWARAASTLSATNSTLRRSARVFTRKLQTLAGDKSHWNEVSDMLYTIGSNNGRMEDIRDGYSQIGQLFHEAWLRDNRPYWLANNMARYDRAAQLWVGRGNAWQNVIQHWWDTHTLAPASEVGLPTPLGLAEK